MAAKKGTHTSMSKRNDMSPGIKKHAAGGNSPRPTTSPKKSPKQTAAA